MQDNNNTQKIGKGQIKITHGSYNYLEGCKLTQFHRHSKWCSQNKK